MDRFVRILENEDWVVDYDKLNNKYRVAMFVNLNFVDEVWFDAYKEKEISQELIDKFCEIPLVNPIRAEDLKKILSK